MSPNVHFKIYLNKYLYKTKSPANNPNQMYQESFLFKHRSTIWIWVSEYIMLFFDFFCRVSRMCRLRAVNINNVGTDFGGGREGLNGPAEETGCKRNSFRMILVWTEATSSSTVTQHVTWRLQNTSLMIKSYSQDILFLVKILDQLFAFNEHSCDWVIKIAE